MTHEGGAIVVSPSSPVRAHVSYPDGWLTISPGDGMGSSRVRFNPEQALSLARWILDTFSDTPAPGARGE